MAIATQVVNGETITFDTEVRDSILAELTPGSGANLADWSIVISGILLAVATRNVVKPASWEIYTNGKALAIDAGTNWLESASVSSLNSAARSFITALGGATSGFFAGSLTGLVLSPTSVAGAAAGVAVGFGVGNATSNLIGDGWDYILGPDIKFLQNLEGTKERILSTGSLRNVLLHHWTNSNPTMSIKDIVNKIGQYELKLSGSTPLEMVYVKNGNLYTFASGFTDENFETLLKYLDVGDYPKFSTNGNNDFELKRNYLNNFGHNYPDFSDQLGRYALLALRPYVTELDESLYASIPSADNYSAKFIADRKALYEDAFIFEEKFGGKLDEFDAHYIDLKYGIETDWGIFKNVIGFGKGGGAVLEGTMLDDRLYGVAYNGDGLSAYDDVIKGGKGDDYIEGGRGNDRLYGGDGDDIIYAYADAIDSSAPLTYQSSYSDYIEGGDDNDTIYGSKNNDVLYGDDVAGNDSGKDIIYGYGGSDAIYGGADDDTLIGGDDNASDALFGGSGADVLLGGGGDDSLSGGDATNLYGDKEIDYLEGGVGYDTYFVSHQDIISDADNDGFILFNDKQLNGKKTKVDANTYEDANFTYSLDGNNLIVVDKNLGEYITIENFQDGAMGINLDKEEENTKDILVKISDPTVVEGNEGVSYMSFTIETSRPLKADESVTLKLSTEEFTATSDDYGTLSANTITLNASNSSQTVTLEILGDTEIEEDEDLWLNAEVIGQTDLGKVTTEIGLATIENDDNDDDENDEDNQDDANTNPIKVTISDASLEEDGGSMEFTISIEPSLKEGETLSIDLTTIDDSAIGGRDYAGLSGTVTFDHTSNTQTFAVPIIDDTYKESTENFTLAVVNATHSNGKEVSYNEKAVGTIIDNDANGDIAIEVADVSATEGHTPGQSAQVTVSLSSALSKDIHISLSNGGYVEIPAGSTSAKVTITWDGDTIIEENEVIPIEILGSAYEGPENVVFGGNGSLTILDDDKGKGHQPPYDPTKPGMSDPLVLDIDKDGFISTISLQDSNAYFDITGDGVKERVGWIASNDGILAYDKNENGKIDGIDEVFGSGKISGFTELRQVADSNYDGVIDRRDELYSRLKV